MQRLEVSGAIRLIYRSLGVKGLKDEANKTNPHTLEEPENNICREISTISGEKLHRINNNSFRSYTDYIRPVGRYFQHLL